MHTFDNRLFIGLLLAAAITAGFAVPGLSGIFEPFALPSLFCMIVFSLVPFARLDLKELFSMDQNVWRIVLWQMFVLPAIILAAATLAKFSDSMITLMAVTACAGSLFASPALADLLGLNQRKALQCMVLSTFVMPVSYVLFMTFVLHSSMDVNFMEFAQRSAIFLLVPAAIILAYSSVAKRLAPAAVQSVELVARWSTIIALMIFGVGILGPATALLWTDPERFLLYLFIVAALGTSMAFMTAIVMYRQGITDALTASVVSGFRNVGLGFVLLSGLEGTDAATYVGISQIPIFLAPLVMRLFIPHSAEDRSYAQAA